MKKHYKNGFENKRGFCVEVRNNNIDGAIRMLNRKIKQDGLLKELRARSFYEKPSVKRRRQHLEAVSRWRKLLSQNKDL